MSLRESDLQAAIIRWASTMEGKYPELEWLAHCPNGGRRNGFEAMNLKLQGVRPGILDLFLQVPRGGYHGFWMELKKPNSREVPTKEQERYMAFLDAQGYWAGWSNDFEEVKSILVDYLEGRITNER